MAALALNKHIMSAAADVGSPVSTVICHVFYNKQGLSRILQVSLSFSCIGGPPLTRISRCRRSELPPRPFSRRSFKASTPRTLCL